MIGYYVHHQGMGHAHRAIAIAGELRTEVTGLSSLEQPSDWGGAWIRLPRDDEDPFPIDPDVGGQLHWAPERCDGLRSRMAKISQWIEAVRPDLMVVDVSVEVALLARLHGVPVVTMVLPGRREDQPHRLVHDIARRLIAAWPADVHGMVSGIAEDDPRLVHVGGFSRFDGRNAPPVVRGGHRRVTAMIGRGGTTVELADLERARASTPGWTWTILGLTGWDDDPWDALVQADVVVAHAGESSIAEIAAARRPAILVPQDRPFDEQRASATALRQDGRFPAVALEAFPESGWSGLLALASELDGHRWELWNDGAGAARAARVIEDEIAS